jgi:hypothetical protein
MKVMLKQSLGMLALILWVTGCANTPFSQQPASKKPVTKAPVVDRSTRQQPAGTYGRQPSPQVEIGQVPEEDPLVPREYSSAYPAPSAYPRGGAQPPSAYPRGGAQSPPAYPPGAATQYLPASRPYSASPADGYGGTASPAPGALPEPQPVVPRTPRTPPKPADAPPASASTSEPTPEPASAPVPEPAQPPVAMATPPAAPSAPKPARPAPPADLPPAEITREGNQAVAALLDSADKYVKSNQLDKAGAALERALRIEPRNAGIWHDLAQIRLHQSEYQQAESLASKSNNLAAGNRTLQARNWKVIASARKASGNVGGAEEAEARASQLSH